MEQSKLNEISKSIESFRLPQYNEIPDIGLFLEQTCKFVSEYFDSISSITITPSMISNYVKKDLIPNPVKKQYYRDQIVLVFFIAAGKSVLSLENIQTMLTIQQEKYSIREAYEYFCKEFLQVLRFVFGLDKELAPIDNANEEKLLLRNTLSSVAYKIYLDKCFEYLNQ